VDLKTVGDDEMGEDIDTRIERMFEKFKGRPEKGRRAVKLLAHHLTASDEELEDFLHEGDRDGVRYLTTSMGIAQSILYTRGADIKEFKGKYAGAYISCLGDGAGTGFIFKGTGAGTGSEFIGDEAGMQAEFLGHEAGRDLAFKGYLAGAETTFYTGMDIRVSGGTHVGAGSVFEGERAGEKALFHGRIAGVRSKFMGKGAGAYATFLGRSAGITVKFEGERAGEYSKFLRGGPIMSLDRDIKFEGKDAGREATIDLFRDLRLGGRDEERIPIIYEWKEGRGKKYLSPDMRKSK
jgi:hypothetical protein